MATTRAAAAAAKNGVKVTPGKPKAAPKKFFPPMPEVTEDDAGAADDFRTFWETFRAEQKPATTTILGVVVTVPTDLPLYFDDVQERLANSDAAVDSEEARGLFEELCTVLFGDGTLNTWRENGLTSMMLRVITMWGLGNAQGKPMTFAEAGEMVKKQLAEEAEGKPAGPNRADRRKAASSKTPASSSTGQRSRRISPGSTASPRPS